MVILSNKCWKSEERECNLVFRRNVFNCNKETQVVKLTEQQKSVQVIFGGDKPQPVIRLRSQAALNVVKSIIKIILLGKGGGGGGLLNKL